MDEITYRNGKEKRLTFPGRKLLLSGFLVLWGASIALALVLRTLLTPQNFPVGSDPSFEIALAAAFAILCLVGLLLAWRGILLEEDRLQGNLARYTRIATLITLGLFGLTVIVGGLIFSANNAFATQFAPRAFDQPRPDYSFTAFPTPALAQPIPTYNPGSKHLSGALNSSMDGLRVGDVFISMPPDGETIQSIQISVNRILCYVQENGAATTYAVDQSKQLISGPLQVQPDGSFCAGQEMVSLHGIFSSPDEAHGTLYLRYIDPASQRTCDLGNFEWTATSTDR